MSKEIKRLTQLSKCQHLSKIDRDAITWAVERLGGCGPIVDLAVVNYDSVRRGNAFELFYSAGLVKKSRKAAESKFASLVKQMKCDPMEFAQLLAADIQQRIQAQQFGIDRLHPSTYLNQQRWTDEITNDGQPKANGSRQSAAERIAARNAAKYSGGGLGMAEGRGDIRGAVDEGEWRASIIDVDSGPQ